MLHRSGGRGHPRAAQIRGRPSAPCAHSRQEDGARTGKEAAISEWRRLRPASYLYVSVQREIPLPPMSEQA